MTKEEALLEEIISRYHADDGMLIPMMQDLQAEYGYLPAEQLRRFSRQLEIPLSRIYGVATFYSSFRLAPKGEHEITLCMGTVCFLKGADKISRSICGEYKIIGTAIDETDFDEYEILITPEDQGSIVFQKIVRREVGRLGAGELLANWDTTKVEDDIYIINLTVMDRLEGHDDT